MSETRAVTVYCASSLGGHPAYVHAANSLGKALANSGRPLVYGGGSGGLMGVVSGSVLNTGGDVTGIVPYAMVAAGGEVDQIKGERHGPSIVLQEKGRERVNNIIVNSMHERKLELARRSCGFIGLPGGYGTFEEVLEVASWSQLGIHEKPIIILNVLGFFNPLRDLIRNGVREGFIPAPNEALVWFIDGPEFEQHDAYDWGRVAIAALDSWKPSERTHYYDWTVKGAGQQGRQDPLDAA
ncbi:uncharacterized protein FIBRA_08027 [Fibroporia radiculosa]|uniref:Cytokinin riboside 5'-monophosphate phosphoribohydrolase n=1 Tax=Fibroporia radiculosa TaxID=599839 RepID=J4H4Y4_9APHY|nr:uncharacterized protein FIBRA_08027 [Fibroporia radiculosa]CCM05794.1 predicted protein [Fibroporia radiculosa]